MLGLDHDTESTTSTRPKDYDHELGDYQQMYYPYKEEYFSNRELKVNEP